MIQLFWLTTVAPVDKLVGDLRGLGVLGFTLSLIGIGLTMWQDLEISERVLSHRT